MNKPLVSIVIPTYNRAKIISRAIESVQAQTYSNWELYIIDDGSIDNTKNIVNEYIKKDKRVRYLHQENSGPGSARNLGIKNANGEYITFLDSDDSYVSNRVQKMIESIGECDFCSSQLIWNKSSKKHIFSFTVDENSSIFPKILTHNLKFLSGTNIFLSRNFIKSIGLFDESMFQWEDVDFYIRCFKFGKFNFIKEPLINYFEHEENITSKPKLEYFKIFYIKNIFLYKKYKVSYVLDLNMGVLMINSGYLIEGVKYLRKALAKNFTVVMLAKVCLYLFKSVFIKLKML